MQKLEYKVYVHRRLDTDAVFYVGHGRHARPWAIKRGRSAAWTAVYNSVGRRVEIVARYADKDSAAQHEKDLIASYRLQGAALVNIKEGGHDRNIGCAKSLASRVKISRARLQTNGSAKSIETPLGQFPSMAQAAQAHGMSLDQIYYRVRKHPDYNLC
jgi:hypothetical protein